MFDAVGKAGWADKMQRCSAMQAPAAADQNPQNGQYADTKLWVTRNSWRGESGVKSPRSNSSARWPNRKSMNSPGSENGSLIRLGLNEPGH